MRMLRPIFGLTILVLLATAALDASADTRALVLVTASPSLAEAVIDPGEARRMYLGQIVLRDRQRVLPLINHSDKLLHEVFLQKVIYMSGTHYERQLISQVFRSGGQRPKSFEHLDDLVTALYRTSGSISYMWKNDAESRPELQIITVLWQGPLE